jgi:hypothetical protein
MRCCVDRGGLVIDRLMVPRRGTFTLIVPDSICFEVTESGRTIRLDFRPRTLRASNFAAAVGLAR